ncbi:hypothetical protein BG20_I1776 [Candidatus Nitrosarchaeum limnium BG20]|uniref:YgjP-like metallopeptidase domain-containing protein n=1 Tax=Candidatus Nitrosarchaeum limnium BG20 TaxID=859192 RepID=S2ENR9_9ARCH|nr:hypothetical protein BG20_I1776 [Candidatus Nitrosarchaeum limnium BG20]
MPYLGKNYDLKIMLSDYQNSILFTNNEFQVTVTRKKPSKKAIEEIYQNWLLESARKLFQNKTKKLAKKLSISQPKIIIKNLKNKWGSITANNIVTLNQNLAKAPSDVIDYVILHELCHVKIKEHDHHFWNYVKKFMPNYHDKVRWLELHSKQIV